MTLAYDYETAILIRKILIAEQKRTHLQRGRILADLGESPLDLAAKLDRNYHPRPHLKVISDAITEIHKGVNDSLIIVCPPQSGKSVTAAVWTPLWWLLNHPRHRVIVASYSEGLAVKRGKAIRTLIDQHSERLGMSLKYGSTAATDWDLETLGGLKSVGVGSGLTGHPGDLLILDDPHKDRQSADSVVQREAVADWYSSVFLTRRSPGAPVIIILTRWNPDDIVGRLIREEGRKEDGGKWRVVHMPAIATDPANDPLGRSLGDPLPHPKIGITDRAGQLQHWETARASVTMRDWNALYQGDPQPLEGALLSPEQLRNQYYPSPKATPIKHAVAVDPSGGGRDNAGIIAGWLGDDLRLYLTHDKSMHGPSEKWAAAACMLAADTNADIIFVEKNYGGDMATLVIRTAWEELRRTGYPGTIDRVPPQIKDVHARKGKLLRAEPIAQQWITDRIRLVNRLYDMEQQWQSWQPTNPESPGNLDASVHLAHGLLPIPGSAAVVSPPQRRKLPEPPVG